MLVFYLNLKSHTHSPADSQPLPADKTGPSNASTAIIIIGDIFGGGSQVLQGADILAYGGHSANQYAVYYPDFLRGQYAHHEWFTASTSENQPTRKRSNSYLLRSNTNLEEVIKKKHSKSHRIFAATHSK